MKKEIGCCGLDCEKCDVYIATKNNDNDLREKTAKLWSELNHVEITADMLNCMGCRKDGIKTIFCDSMCEIKKCVANKHIDTCAECENMEGCKKAEFIFNSSPEAKNNLKNK